ncbi:MAG: DUF3160 domain-containing protein [Acidobacteria bacterium]|nr:DUF3160 domain-containing protein [Acidobacteriota bacterium]
MYLFLLFGIFSAGTDDGKWIAHLTPQGSPFPTRVMLSNTGLNSELVILTWFLRDGTPLESTTLTMRPMSNESFEVPFGASHVQAKGQIQISTLYGSPSETIAQYWAVPLSQSFTVELPDLAKNWAGIAVVLCGDRPGDIQLQYLDEQNRVLQTTYPGSLSGLAPFEKGLSLVKTPAQYLRVSSNQPFCLVALSGPKNLESISSVQIQPNTEVPVVYGPSDWPETAQGVIRDFREALTRFQDLDEETFFADYSTGRNYLEQVGYDPSASAGLDLILDQFPLADEQWQAFQTNGFILTKTPNFPTFYAAYREIYKRDLPVYISADCILDTLHLAFDRLLMDLERFILRNNLAYFFNTIRMQGHLMDAVSGENSTSLRRDFEWWAYTSQAVLYNSAGEVPDDLRNEVKVFLDAMHSETTQVVEIFGQQVLMDFSQFKPRGHYTHHPELESYFRTIMFLQRLPFMIEDNPRHAAIAWAISEQSHLAFESLEQVLRIFFGPSDSMNVFQMHAIAEELQIPNAEWFYEPSTFQSFRARLNQEGLGTQQILSQILAQDPTSADFTPLPTLFHVMGQRYSVDSHVFSNVVWDRVPATASRMIRTMPDPLDALFSMGNRFALEPMKPEIRTFKYHRNLAAMDWVISGFELDFWQSNWYHAWLAAMLKLNADTSTAVFPETMRTQAWEYKTLNAQLGSWAQLRHDSVLYVKQSYGGWTCEYPDGWIDPYPEFYAALAQLIRKTQGEFEGLGLLNRTVYGSDGSIVFSGQGLKSFLTHFSKTLEKLSGLAETMRQGSPLTEEGLTFINGMLVHNGCVSDDYQGWFSRLIYGFDLDKADDFEPTLADVHTDPNGPSYLQVGAGYPRLMIVTIDQGCGPRAYVGPVFGYHQFQSNTRQTDEWFKKELQAGKGDAWLPAWLSTILK